MADPSRFDAAIAAIDAANAEDPNTIVVDGSVGPKELAHARLVTGWVHRLDAEPSETLLLAARAHHLRRWAVPRASHPTGRAGYLRWRRELHGRHAADVGAILRIVGYSDTTVERVQQLVAKRDPAGDPDGQVLEDALCLTFLETQFHDLAARLPRDRMLEVVRRTLAKMSAAAVDLAGSVDLDPDAAALLAAAAGPE